MIEWSVIGVPLVVAVGAIVVLLTDAFVAQAGWRTAGGISAAALVGAGCWLGATGSSGGVALGFSWVLLVSTAVVVALCQVLDDDPAVPPGELSFLLLLSASGALTLAVARDFVTLVIALELLALPSIVLVGIRSGSLRGIRSAWTFFVLSVSASAVTLMGISLLYGVTGTLTYDGVLTSLQSQDRTDVGPEVLGAIVVLTLVGLLLKVGAVPFHLWIPDAYRGAPIPVAAYLSVVSKGGALAALLVVLAYPFLSLQPRWDVVIAVVAALSMTVGNIGALVQREMVSMLAWSSVAQAGFLLAPLVALRVNSPVVSAAPLRYLAVFALANLTAFAVAALVVRRFGGTDYDRLAGLARRDPVTGAALIMALLTLAGFPPAVIGLLAKYLVIQPVILGGYAWLAVAIALNIAAGLVYYLRLVVVVFAPRERWRTDPDDPQAATGGGEVTVVRPRRGGVAITEAIVVLGLLALVATSLYPTMLLGPLLP
ncbi:NADH-quinone oxidoreductase subunit N [Mumia flava]|uniref:NADH-quinone oxidoreductase subunit N n=1 Tax=Mumia flava TaxID=1348852 RepID=A0A2M9BJZ6_9ACTN|nr:proton-conducting transporter membrane subunit [Mumia flava]PJJ58275.1 NADH-quinone oxidoreductase subunit N [Mumia flava]